MEGDWIERILRWAQYGVIGTFGGAAAYVYLVASKGGKFQLLLFFSNLFLAFFVGKVMGTILPDVPTMPEYRDGMVMVAGFCTYPILRMFEDRFATWVGDRFFPKSGE